MSGYKVYGLEDEMKEGGLSWMSEKSVVNFCEIWRELPGVTFEEVTTANGGRGLRMKSANRRIYVSPSTVEVLSTRPLLLAVCTLTGPKTNVFWVAPVEPAGIGEAAAVTRARMFNEEHIGRARAGKKTPYS